MSDVKAELRIEIPESMDIWGRLTDEFRGKIALFAYLEGESVEEYILNHLSAAVEGDESFHQYVRERGGKSMDIVEKPSE